MPDLSGIGSLQGWLGYLRQKSSPNSWTDPNSSNGEMNPHSEPSRRNQITEPGSLSNIRTGLAMSVCDQDHLNDGEDIDSVTTRRIDSEIAPNDTLLNSDINLFEYELASCASSMTSEMYNALSAGTILGTAGITQHPDAAFRSPASSETTIARRTTEDGNESDDAPARVQKVSSVEKEGSSSAIGHYRNALVENVRGRQTDMTYEHDPGEEEAPSGINHPVEIASCTEWKELCRVVVQRPGVCEQKVEEQMTKTGTSFDAPKSAPQRPAEQSETDDGSIDQDAILKFRVGERIFHARVGTLIGESTYFESQLSGRWLLSKVKNATEEGTELYLDLDPDDFKHILNYLRTNKMPLFWDSRHGFDYSLYARVLACAEYLGVDKLVAWIQEKKFTAAVTYALSAECTTGLRDIDLSMDIGTTRDDEICTVTTEWKEEKTYLCPRRIVVHRGNPHKCGRACERARDDEEVEYAVEPVLWATVVRKKLTLNLAVLDSSSMTEECSSIESESD